MASVQKVASSRERLRQVFVQFGPKIAVGWTGGKDSTVVLALWREVLAEFEPRAKVLALNLDTGCKFPEVLSFRDQLARAWGLDLRIVRPDLDLARYPLAADPLSCCRDLKITPLATAIARLEISALLTGVRADENPERGERPWLEEYSDPVHVRAAPILDWSELEIWTFLARESIPWCSLYDQGYRSLGCMPCTSIAAGGERSGRDARKETQMAQLHSLGYF